MPTTDSSYVDCALLVKLLAFWNDLTTEQRDGLYADALQATLANRARTRAGRPALRLVSRGKPTMTATAPDAPEAA